MSDQQDNQQENIDHNDVLSDDEDHDDEEKQVKMSFVKIKGNMSIIFLYLYRLKMFTQYIHQINLRVRQI